MIPLKTMLFVPRLEYSSEIKTVSETAEKSREKINRLKKHPKKFRNKTGAAVFDLYHQRATKFLPFYSLYFSVFISPFLFLVQRRKRLWLLLRDRSDLRLVHDLQELFSNQKTAMKNVEIMKPL